MNNTGRTKSRPYEVVIIQISRTLSLQILLLCGVQPDDLVLLSYKFQVTISLIISLNNRHSLSFKYLHSGTTSPGWKAKLAFRCCVYISQSGTVNLISSCTRGELLPRSIYDFCTFYKSHWYENHASSVCLALYLSFLTHVEALTASPVNRAGS